MWLLMGDCDPGLPVKWRLNGRVSVCRFRDTGKQLVQRHSRWYHGRHSSFLVPIYSGVFPAGAVGILSTAGSASTR